MRGDQAASARADGPGERVAGRGAGGCRPAVGPGKGGAWKLWKFMVDIGPQGRLERLQVN
jgi:hypothetical protein